MSNNKPGPRSKFALLQIFIASFLIGTLLAYITEQCGPHQHNDQATTRSRH